MDMNKFIKTIFFLDIIQGMALTMKNFILSLPVIDKIAEKKRGRKTLVTREYPEEPFYSMPGFRGMHALVREESGKERCIACALCAAVCPSQCIYIKSKEGLDGVKYAERYEVEVLRCTFCGLCVEACPVCAIVLTEHYAYADYSREAFYMDKQRLLKNWDEHMAGDKGRIYMEKFWHPIRADFEGYENQPVLKRKEGGN